VNVPRFDGHWLDREVRRRQVATAFSELYTKSVGQLVLIGLFLWLFRRQVPSELLFGWAAVQAGMTVSTLLVNFAYRRAVGDPFQELRWANVYTVFAGLSGLAWGCGAALFFQPDRMPVQVGLAAVITVLGALSAGLHVLYRPHFMAFVSGLFPPYILRLAAEGEERQLALAAACTFAFVYFIVAGRRATLRSEQSIRTQIENERLAEGISSMQTRLGAAIEAIGEAFVIFDSRDRLIHANSRFRDMVSLAGIETGRAGLTYALIVRQALARGLFVEADDPAGESIEQILYGARKGRPAVEMRLSDGRWFRIVARHTAQGDLVGVLTDVTQVRSRTEALRESERRLRTIMGTVPDAILTTDPDGVIETVNRAGERLLGLPAAQLTGKSLRDFLTGVQQELLQATDGATHEVMIRRHDGSSIAADLSVGAMELADGNRLVAVFRDVSERKAQQAQLVQSSKLASLGEIATGLAHELNQPLNIIRMAADSCLILMADGMADAEFQRSQLGLISGQTVRMAKIIEHMRVFGRKDSADAVRFSAADTVRSALSLVQEQLRVADIGVTTRLPDRCRQVQGFPLRLEQVLLNLLNNARDAIVEHPRRNSGGDSLIGRITIEVSDDRSRDEVVISVSDTGGGIPQPALERVFDPFFTTKEAGKGTGLGLSISYAIIGDMDGRLAVRNGPEGAVFTISLPALREARKEKSAR
jgi:PAS domain S-box-containing protein